MIFPALLLAAQATTAAAIPSDPTLFDLRCLVVMANLSEHEEQTFKHAGQMGVFYFLGRLDGRLPSEDVAPLLEREFEAIEEQDPGPYLKACGELMEVRGQQLVEWSQQNEVNSQAR